MFYNQKGIFQIWYAIGLLTRTYFYVALRTKLELMQCLHSRNNFCKMCYILYMYYLVILFCQNIATKTQYAPYIFIYLTLFEIYFRNREKENITLYNTFYSIHVRCTINYSYEYHIVTKVELHNNLQEQGIHWSMH